MRRILITERLKVIANEFLSELKNKHDAVEELQKLHDDLNGKADLHHHVNYLKELISKYDSVITATPNQFQKILTTTLTEDQLKQEITVKVKKRVDEDGKKVTKPMTTTKKFYEVICDAMGYPTVRNKVFPPYAERLGIKSCVYCNGQYGITVEKDDGGYTSTYEIDHFRPQSHYPHLSTSFFNLQPSCSHCNKTKNKYTSYFNLYIEDPGKISPFKFRIPHVQIFKYMMSRDFNNLDIRLECNEADLLKNHEDRFRVSQKYERHKDEAAELIIKSRIYNKAYMDQLHASFRKIVPQFHDVLSDVIIGFPTNSQEVHKRPLTLMKQDIARQLGLLDRDQ